MWIRFALLAACAAGLEENETVSLTLVGKDQCAKTCSSDGDCGGCGFCFPAPHSCCSAGVTSPLDCPSTVAAPSDMVTLYKITGDMCGQATLDAKYASPAKSFAGLKEGNCADQNYTVAAGTQELNVPVIGKIEIKKFTKAGVSIEVGIPAEMVTLYKVSGDTCGQATLDAKYAGPARSFAGLKDGNCADQGYTVAAGTQELNVPVLGKIEIKKFTKAGAALAVGTPAEMMTLYKISGEKCGQATLDAKYASQAKSFAGLKEGSCVDQGYTVADGSQELNVPVLGKIQIKLFTKAAESMVPVLV